MVTDILYKNLTYKIRACFFEVYNKLGCGFKESVYHKALAYEFQLQGIIFENEEELPVFYKDKQVGAYKPDFIVDKKVIVEIKAQPKLLRLDELQLYYYLKGTEYSLGFLVNFGGDKLDIRRKIAGQNPR